MKKTVNSIASIMMAYTLFFCSPLMADTTSDTSEEPQFNQKIKEEIVLEPIDMRVHTNSKRCIDRDHKKDHHKEHKEKEHCEHHQKPVPPPPADPRIEHLYAFNSGPTGATGINPGDDVPFNNGNSAFPPTPLQVGRAFHQLDNTDFLIFENGDYLVTFYGYTDIDSAPPTGVQLFLDAVATGPNVPLNTTAEILSFSQIIRVTGKSITNPALLEVKVTGEMPLTFQGGINATLEIVKLSSAH